MAIGDHTRGVRYAAIGRAFTLALNAFIGTGDGELADEAIGELLIGALAREDFTIVSSGIGRAMDRQMLAALCRHSTDLRPGFPDVLLGTRVELSMCVSDAIARVRTQWAAELLYEAMGACILAVREIGRGARS